MGYKGQERYDMRVGERRYSGDWREVGDAGVEGWKREVGAVEGTLYRPEGQSRRPIDLFR